MSRTPQQRIDDALSQLVERLVPPLEGEEEGAADERYFRALDFTKEAVDNTNAPTVVRDEAHVADLIRQTIVRRRSTPSDGLEFTNLYSRLCSRPVLSQKWAILHLLHQLSDGDADQEHVSSPRPLPTRQTNGTHNARPPPLQTRPQQQESRLLDDAFARPSLSTMASPRRVDHIRHESPRVSPRADPQPRRRRDMTNGEASPGLASPKGFAPNRYSPSEASLLRDLPFTFQGVSSSNLSFSGEDTLKIPPSLPIPIVSLLHTLAEPSLLYKRLVAFVESSDGGLIGQSLRAAISIELRSYLGLVATLEGQIRRALATLEDPATTNSLGRAGATLKRCVVWTREATLGLRLMSVIADSSKVKAGGQIISLIHSLASSHGDPFVSDFAERLRSHVTRPFYDMLRSWIYDGELSDPYQEFFVSEQSPKDDDNASTRGAATSVWEDKYALDSDMIPSIITEEFAKKVFLIGKSLNFIRHACSDAAWVESYSKRSSRELRYGENNSSLSSSVDEAYTATMARLIHLMTSKFHLLTHLRALKSYLLLGAGDFISLLMESLATSLSKPANSQYRHTLTAQLEHAIRNSNAQHDSPDVLRRLDARMLELSMGEIGWDVFTLEYKTDAPVDVVVSAWANIQYLKIFNFLWRIKRVEFALGTTWAKCMTGARGILSVVEDKKAQITSATSTNSSTTNLANLWKTTRATTHAMIHLTSALQYYILFHVIESAWSTLLTSITKQNATLDDIITAHTKYLKSITRKGLLSTSSGGTGSSTSINFTTQLHELLKLMLAYREAVDALYAYSVAEASRSEARQARIESRTRAGRWGTSDRDRDHEDDEDLLAQPYTADQPLGPPLLDTGTGLAAGALITTNTAEAIGTRLKSLSNDYKARVTILLGDLAHQPDQELRFLGVSLNFNDWCVVPSRRSKSSRKPAVGSRESKEEKAAVGGGEEGGDAGDAGNAGEREGGKGDKGEKSENARGSREDKTGTAREAVPLTHPNVSVRDRTREKGKERARGVT